MLKKAFWMVLLPVVLGLLLGVGIGFLRIRSVAWDGNLGGSDEQTAELRNLHSNEPPPYAVIEQTEAKLGKIDELAKGSHTFVIRNTGEGPLRLTDGGTSCGCTALELLAEEIPPGGSSNVVVRWSAEGKQGDFRETALVRTNDPRHRRVTFTLRGEIVVAIRVIPSALTFGRMVESGADDQILAFREAIVYSFLEEHPLEITSHQLENPATAGSFQVAISPVSKEQLEQVPGALSGQQIRISVKSGLPEGGFRQTITLSTNSKSMPTVTIPIKGTIGKEIEVIGKGGEGYGNGTLKIGSVSPREEVERTLFLFARGAEQREVAYRITETTPEFLDVALGETTAYAKGTVFRTPLTVRIPRGSPEGSYLGARDEKPGRITITTDHPRVPTITILVHFAIRSE